MDQLREALDRDVEVVWDERNDRWDTGRRCWLAHDPAATHHLVVQDDTIPCRDLIAGVEAAIPKIGEKAGMSLYAGRVRPFRTLVDQLVTHAKQERAAWLTMGQCHWGPGLLLPTALIADMLAWCDKRSDVANYDKRLGRWSEHTKLTWWYPWPSLLDHRVEGNPSLVPGRSPSGRHAHKFIGANKSALTDWDPSGRVASIPHLSTAKQPTHRRPMVDRTSYKRRQRKES